MLRIRPLAVFVVAAPVVVGVVWRFAPAWLRSCDTVGAACCRADGEVETDHRHAGLGCDLQTRECAACGAAGQPCCDGHLTGCSHGGCMNRTYFGRDEDAAKRCAEASSPGCTVSGDACP